MDGAPTWWRYDSTGRRFDPDRGAPGDGRRCVRRRPIFGGGRSRRRAAGAPGWQPWNMFAFNGGDLYGKRAGDFWNTATNTWGHRRNHASPRGPRTSQSGCAEVPLSCSPRTHRRFQRHRSLGHQKRPRTHGSTGTGPGCNGQAWLPPDPSMLKVVTDTQVRWRDSPSQEWSYQPATNQWTQVPPQTAVTAANGALTTATILGRPVLTDEKTNILTTLPPEPLRCVTTVPAGPGRRADAEESKRHFTPTNFEDLSTVGFRHPPLPSPLGRVATTGQGSHSGDGAHPAGGSGHPGGGSTGAWDA